MRRRRFEHCHIWDAGRSSHARLDHGSFVDAGEITRAANSEHVKLQLCTLASVYLNRRRSVQDSVVVRNFVSFPAPGL